MDEFIIVLCTVPSIETATSVADDLVNGGYAACVNIVPGLSSIYRWKGEICRDNELLLIIKSKKSLFEIMKERIITLHPYQVPEIIAVTISAGSEKYLDWIKDSTQA